MTHSTEMHHTVLIGYIAFWEFNMYVNSSLEENIILGTIRCTNAMFVMTSNSEKVNCG